MSGTTRWRIDLEYDGSAFEGWQIQREARTIQGAVTDAAERLLGHPTLVSGAGRTDAGVHAKQQVASFLASVERSPYSVVAGLNANLPQDVACVAATVVPESFDPRHSPHTKRYVYTMSDRATRSPLERARVWHLRAKLDECAMAEAAQYLVGTHDFTSFRATGCSSTHAVRTIERAEVTRRGDHVELALHGTGFLRHMVRIVAGTISQVGRGSRPPEWMAEVIAARHRDAAHCTAPARALCLEAIVYREGVEEGV